MKAPSAWKPVSSAVKPVVEVVKPESHIDHVHVQPGHVHLAPHVDQVHQITVPHGAHYDTFAHVDHLPVRPFVPSPVLFEVTRPNLGVLPLGAKFLTPVLKDYPRIPHVHVPAPVPVFPAPVPVAPHFHSIPSQPPHFHSHLIPQIPSGVSVEYHGTRNYLPLGTGAQALPFEHPGHAFAPQQALPHEHHAHFLQQQQHLHALQQYQDIPQGQLPLEGEEGSVIQPGHTDVQIPYHLPQHGAWPEDFRPSPQLQTPYHK